MIVADTALYNELREEEYNATGNYFCTGTLGDAQSGKTTLTQALLKATSYTKVIAQRTCCNLSTNINTTSYARTSRFSRFFRHLDFPGQSTHNRCTWRYMHFLNAPILVISAIEGIMPQTIHHVRLAAKYMHFGWARKSRTNYMPILAVFLNKCDLVHDAELLDIAEDEITNLLQQALPPLHRLMHIPIIRGSALKAVQGDTSPAGLGAVKPLIQLLEDALPQLWRSQPP